MAVGIHLPLGRRRLANRPWTMLSDLRNVILVFTLFLRHHYQVETAFLSRLLSNQPTFSSHFVTATTSRGGRRKELLDVGARARNRTVNLGIKRGQKVGPAIFTDVQAELKVTA